MSVRLKFFVSSKQEAANTPGGEKVGSGKLSPVTTGSEENKSFYRWTPSGSIEFSSINQSALDALPLGAEVYIDLKVVPKS